VDGQQPDRAGGEADHDRLRRQQGEDHGGQRDGDVREHRHREHGLVAERDDAAQRGRMACEVRECREIAEMSPVDRAEDAEQRAKHRRHPLGVVIADHRGACDDECGDHRRRSKMPHVEPALSRDRGLPDRIELVVFGREMTGVDALAQPSARDRQRVIAEHQRRNEQEFEIAHRRSVSSIEAPRSAAKHAQQAVCGVTIATVRRIAPS
jgi:hypothetical protein